jgi:hypothetical protein
MAIKWEFHGDSFVEIITDDDGNVVHVISGGNRDPEIEREPGKLGETVRVDKGKIMAPAQANRPHAVVGITGIPQTIGTLRSPIDSVVNFELPSVFTAGDMRKVERDLEIVGNLVRHHTKQMCDLHNAVLEGRLADAVAVGRRLGLQEHRFVAAGGGLGWVGVVAAIMVGVLVAEAISAPPAGSVDHGEPSGISSGGDDDGEDGEGEEGE